MSEKILTLHPEGKEGVNIDKAKYDQVKEAILAILEQEPALTFAELNKVVHEVLRDGFNGSIPWYFTTVKLDLEARSMIARIPNTKPERYRVV